MSQIQLTTRSLWFQIMHILLSYRFVKIIQDMDDRRDKWGYKLQVRSSFSV